MPEVASSQVYIDRLLSLPRPGEEKILAFYEHRLGLICTNPRLLLMPLDDHMAHRGDGVFESLKAERGRVYLLDEHIRRLENSANGMGLIPPCSYPEIREHVLSVARAGGEPACMLRVLLGRGPGGFGIDPAESPQNSLYIVACRFQPKAENYYQQKCRAFRSRYPARQSGLARIKNTNYQTGVAMLHEARERGLDLALLFDENDNLAEAAVSNVCLICRNENKNGSDVKLVVPEFNRALPGTTILRLIELLKPLIPVEVRAVQEKEIFTALELLQTGTTVDCAPITHYEGHPIGNGKPGPWAARIRELLIQDLNTYGIKFQG